MTIIIIIAAIAVAGVLAGCFGVDSRPGFDESAPFTSDSSRLR